MVKSLVKNVILGGLKRSVERVVPVGEFENANLNGVVADRVLELATERGLNQTQRHDLLFEIGRRLLPSFSMNDVGRVFLEDEEFRAWFTRFKGNSGNWKNYERRWMVGQLLRLIDNVPGDLAECGVFEGAAAWQLCKLAGKNGRRVHLFDSFEGVSKPGAGDGSYWAEGMLAASEATVRKNLAEFDCFDTFQGWIPTRFADAGDRYCFLHIDVDLEQPTLDSLAFFYPRMSSGGIILLDDHGYDTCPGARKAALTYMADKPEPVLDLPTGQGLIVKR